MERFIAILTEHFGGAFPAWLAPVQVKIMPVTDKHLDYAQKIHDRLFDRDIRVELDARNEKIGYKIREAQMEKVPYMLVVGDKEETAGTLSVRCRKQGDLGIFSYDDFLTLLDDKIKTMSL
jgi:threonyl-tRNA synthetase